MTTALLAGAFFGLGVYLLFRAILPPRPGLSARLAAFDAAAGRARLHVAACREHGRAGHRVRAPVGRSLAAFYEARGWQQRSVRADLTR